MKKLLTIGLLTTALAGCSMTETEMLALRDAGIKDAREASEEVHLAYLKCYALRNVDKDNCQNQIEKRLPKRDKASLWEYSHRLYEQQPMYDEIILP